MFRRLDALNTFSTWDYFQYTMGLAGWDPTADGGRSLLCSCCLCTELPNSDSFYLNLIIAYKELRELQPLRSEFCHDCLSFFRSKPLICLFWGISVWWLLVTEEDWPTASGSKAALLSGVLVAVTPVVWARAASPAWVDCILEGMVPVVQVAWQGCHGY